MKKIILFIAVTFTAMWICVGATGEFDGIDQINSFGTAQEIIDGILSGSLELNGSNMADNFFSLIFSTLKSDIPMIVSLISCGLVLALAENMRFMGDTGEIAVLGGKMIVAVMIMTPAVKVIQKAGSTLESITKFSTLFMPPITTLLASCGAQTTATVLSPSSVLISTVLINIISKFVFPLTVSGLAVTLCSGCIKRFGGITGLIKSLTVWTVGIVFTLFSGIIALQGIVSSVSDGMSIKGLKYAISSSIPIIGSTVSESASMIITSAYYLKNAGGIMGIIVLLGICLAPLIEIMCFYFALKITAEIMNVFSNGNTGEIVKNSAEYIKLAGIALLGVAVIWFIFLGLIVASGGAV